MNIILSIILSIPVNDIRLGVDAARLMLYVSNNYLSVDFDDKLNTAICS